MARKAGKAKLKAPRTTSRLKEKRRVSNQKAPTQIKGKSKRLQKQAAKLEAAISTTKVKKNTKGKDTKKTIQLLEKIEIPKTNQRGKKMVDFKDIPELIPSISSEDVPGVPIKSPVKRPPIVRALSKVLAVQPQDEVADVSDPDDDEDMAGNDPSKGESTIIANRYILTDPPASPLRPLLIPGQRAKEYSSNLLDASPFIETSRDITKYRMEIRHVVNKHNHLVKRFNHELKIQNELRDKLKQAYEIADTIRDVADGLCHL